jgi:phosphoglycerol transferase MdoB-like AlkP superfamily enzyme
MNFEELQQAWQSHGNSDKVTLDTDLVLKEVRRNAANFRATIFWRDAREIGVAFGLTIFFSYQGMKTQDWTQGLIALACLGVGAFMVIDRLKQRAKQPISNDPLKGCLESSLLQVCHQIWLLKNVAWWYLLPLSVAIGVSMIHSLGRAQNSNFPASVVLALAAVVIGVLYWGIYQLNLLAVRKTLEPRRRELETLLASLQ